MNWFERIDDLEKNWTPSKQRIANKLSQGWTTCMCGQQDPAIPRDEYDNAPLDDELAELGIEFHEAIKYQHWFWARRIGNEIQIRAAWVLANLGTQEAVEPVAEEAVGNGV